MASQTKYAPSVAAAALTIPSDVFGPGNQDQTAALHRASSGARTRHVARGMAMTSSATSQPSEAFSSLPVAGPNAKPQLVEIDVAPWQRIAVLYKAVHASRTAESGSVWYWRPELVSRLQQAGAG